MFFEFSSSQSLIYLELPKEKIIFLLEKFPFSSYTSAFIFSKRFFFDVFQIQNPIGNCPLTLSKVYAGIKNNFSSFARKTSLKSTKFGACKCFNVENCAIQHEEISRYILIKN